MKRITILTGAGMSAESGIKTFRDEDGLWEGHDVMKVATPEGWELYRELVLDFYNQRRRQLLTVKPNAGHLALVELDDAFDTMVITQNIDDLHERAGSRNVLHLHGELRKVRSSIDPSIIYDWDDDVKPGDKCSLGSQLRPHVVWFGEPVPAMEPAIDRMTQTDTVIIIGTSMQVYPAASLVQFAPPDAEVYYVDPRPNINYELARTVNLKVIPTTASAGVPDLVKVLLDARSS